VDLINRILSSCSWIRSAFLSCITSPAPENSLSTPTKVTGIYKMKPARWDKRENFPADLSKNLTDFMLICTCPAPIEIKIKLIQIFSSTRIKNHIKKSHKNTRQPPTSCRVLSCQPGHDRTPGRPNILFCARLWSDICLSHVLLLHCTTEETEILWNVSWFCHLGWSFDYIIVIHHLSIEDLQEWILDHQWIIYAYRNI